MIEIVFVVVIVAVWLMSIITAVNYGLKNVWIAKQRVISINLAREWIEAIYQIRDSNRLSWSSQKDECRLKLNPLRDSLGNDCSDDAWMQSWYYAIYTFVTGGQQIFYLSWWNRAPLDLTDWIQDSDMKYALCENNWIWNPCTWTSYEWQTKYFREIHGLGLFLKDSDTVWWDYIDCENWKDSFPSDCWLSNAKEFRFCSKVAYIWETQWDINICGLITNFKD